MPLVFGLFCPDSPHRENPYHLLIGVDQLGITVAQQLRAHGDQVKFVPLNTDQREKLIEADLPFLEIGPDELQTLSPNPVQSTLVLLEDDKHNLDLARKAKDADFKAVIAQVRDPRHLPEFDEEEIKTFSPALERATMVSMMARSPDVLDLLTTTSDKRDSREVVVRNPRVAGRRLRDLNLPGDLLILAIRRDQQLVISPTVITLLILATGSACWGIMKALPRLRNYLKGDDSLLRMNSSTAIDMSGNRFSMKKTRLPGQETGFLFAAGGEVTR